MRYFSKSFKYNIKDCRYLHILTRHKNKNNFSWSAVTPMATPHQGNARDSGSSQNGVRGCLGVCKTNSRESIDRLNEEKMEETFNEDLCHV